MDQLLLEQLCRICNVHEAKYTCPRCSLQTCSLPCARRHKIRASCNGIRDPTVFKPKSLLATPSGIDQDYNFIHSIEHGIERSENLIVEVKGLVDKEELQYAREGIEDRDPKRRKLGAQRPGELSIQRSLVQTRTTIQRAPKGMRRNLENETSWNKNRKCINWQVEWIRERSPNRILGKAMANSPIGEVYATILEQERLKSLTPDEKAELEERKAESKRQAKKTRKNATGKTKMEVYGFLGVSPLPMLQDPTTGTWSLPSIPNWITFQDTPKPRFPSSHTLYLLLPYTPSHLPKVLIPLDPLESLDVLLKSRTVLEFPTIHVLENVQDELPEGYMLEKDYISVSGQQLVQKDDDIEMNDPESSEAGGDASDTSTSGSDEDEEEDDDMGVGEVVPAIWS